MGLIFVASGGSVTATRAEPVRILYVKGLFHLTLELERGFERFAEIAGREARVASVYYEWDYHKKNPRLIGFPEGPDGLADYDVVVLANVDAIALGEEGVRALARYVEGGGNLLVVSAGFSPTAGEVIRTPGWNRYCRSQ